MKKSWWRYHFTHLYQKPQSYEVYSSWDMEHDRQNFWSFWAIFYPFPPLTNQKIKIFKKWIKKKKCLEISIILHLCTTNHDHKMHGSWDMECDKTYFFTILGHLLPFYPVTTLKIKIWKKYKKHLEILSFYTCVP